MFKFFFKKNFCDIWDNLFHLFILDLIMIVLLVAFAALCIGALSFGGEESGILLFYLALFVSSAVIWVFIFAEGENAAKIANFESPKFSLYFKQLVPCIKDGALFGLFGAFLVSVATISMPYYFRMWLPSDGSQGSFVGLLFLSFIFWFEVVSIFSLQWFLAIRNLMHNSFLKCLKKSYILFFDNTLFSIGLGFVNLLNLLLTIFTLGMIPGFHGMNITVTNALRLRLYKYDWIEVNPNLTKKERKYVPWDELLARDKATLGPRNWRSFIFPWKD
mgnify:CR=1 FL=1